MFFVFFNEGGVFLLKLPCVVLFFCWWCCWSKSSLDALKGRRCLNVFIFWREPLKGK